jgi:hypothetical protein
MVAEATQSDTVIAHQTLHGSLTLNEAAVWISKETGCRRPHVSTLLRWILKGVRGSRLPAQRVGSKYWVRPSELAIFLDELNAPSKRSSNNQSDRGSQQPSPSVVNSLRRQQVDAACGQLERLCGFVPQSKRGEQSLASRSTL